MITAVRIRHADRVAPSICKKLSLTSPTRGGSSNGIVRSRIQAMEFSLALVFSCYLRVFSLFLMLITFH
jgi:hypothetical protein